jgi:excisionase family DNA binding protein
MSAPHPSDDRASVLPGDHEYLRAADLARAFHVSPKTGARWADAGLLPHTTTLGGHRRFPRAAVEALIAERFGSAS